MSPRQAAPTRENFEAGKVDFWKAGGRGSTVRVFVEAGKIKIRHQVPGTKQKQKRTLFDADSAALRKKATAVAVSLVEKLRMGAASRAEMKEERASGVTVFDVVLLYMRRAPGFPEQLFDPKGMGVKAAVEEWYAGLPESVRASKTVPKAVTLWSDLYAFRRLFQDPRFARSRIWSDVEPGDATQYASERAARGGSPRTPVNDLDRLSCAFEYVLEQHRKSVGITYNPIKGRIVDRTKADVPAYEDIEVDRMLRAIEKGEPGAEQWQIKVVLGIASSMRRIGSILSLAASNHDFDAGTVTWEAEHQKGEAYGRGDVTIAMTPLHRAAAEWAIRNRPNPLGPEAPMIWHESDPSRPVLKTTVDQQLRRLEKAAKVEHKKGRAFHGFCRWGITKAADLYGDEKASEFAGRTPDTIRRYAYKKRTPAEMKKVADAMGGRVDAYRTTEESEEK